MKKKNIVFIIGTRPEAIKLACLINLFKKNKKFNVKVILTGQHIELVNSVMDIFKIKPDVIFSALKESKNLSESFSVILKNLQDEFLNSRIDFVFVQGDTTSALVGALASYYNRIPIGHVEAGLRTNSLYEPFPEEGNRRLISQITDLHFAPTQKSFDVLKDSKVGGDIYITGNTVIDSLKYIVSQNPVFKYSKLDLKNKKYILATVHRRENWGKKLIEIAQAFKFIIDKYPEMHLLIPLHPNEIVSKPLLLTLKNHPRIFLVKSLNYINFISALNSCYLLLTDSGGLQEEAPSLNKPVLVLRNTSERSEAIDSGASKLIGNSYENIVNETIKVLNSEDLYKKMANSKNPFGDGFACNKIINIVENFLS